MIPRRASLAFAFLLAIGACGESQTDTPAADRALQLVGTQWQWQEFQDSADGDEGSDITVPDPAKYTLLLRPDESADIQADCNRLSWSYSLHGSQLTFNTLGPGTLAECGERSLDRRFLERLGHTATFVIADGRLYLNLKVDAGNMVFAPAK